MPSRQRLHLWPPLSHKRLDARKIPGHTQPPRGRGFSCFPTHCSFRSILTGFCGLHVDHTSVAGSLNKASSFFILTSLSQVVDTAMQGRRPDDSEASTLDDMFVGDTSSSLSCQSKSINHVEKTCIKSSHQIVSQFRRESNLHLEIV